MLKKVLTFTVLLLVFSITLSQISNSQLNLKNLKKKTEKKVERRVERKVDKGIDNTLDKIEESLDGSDAPAQNNPAKTERKSDNSETDSDKSDAANNAIASAPRSVLNWSAFDFVPGDEIIFEDNLENELNGEFPSKWDLVNGAVENAALDGENVIMFIKTNTNNDGGIIPMMRSGYEDYLPDEFTVEFDAYFDSPGRTYRVLFFDSKNQKKINNSINKGSNHKVDRVKISQNSAGYGDTQGYFPGFGKNSKEDAARSKPGWRRVSISFNKRALKVYIDNSRILNIPNMSFDPLGLTFAYHNPNGGNLGYIKSIRVAKGAVPLYNKMLTDGKIIANGIRFDVNKATLKPESFGVINEIVKLMKDKPEINFSVEGHTDSDGNASHNQALSEERAKTVVDEMVKMGISSGRLKHSGHGQSKPITGNDTSEGKAQNRRVEFIKF